MVPFARDDTYQLNAHAVEQRYAILLWFPYQSDLVLVSGRHSTHGITVAVAEITNTGALWITNDSPHVVVYY